MINKKNHIIRLYVIRMKKKIRLLIYNNEKEIINKALIEFRNEILRQGRDTTPIDELIIKINK